MHAIEFVLRDGALTTNLACAYHPMDRNRPCWPKDVDGYPIAKPQDLSCEWIFQYDFAELECLEFDGVIARVPVTSGRWQHDGPSAYDGTPDSYMMFEVKPVGPGTD